MRCISFFSLQLTLKDMNRFNDLYRPISEVSFFLVKIPKLTNQFPFWIDGSYPDKLG